MKKFTQEVRLASHDNDRFEWLVGGYYNKEDGLIEQDFVAFNLAPRTPTRVHRPWSPRSPRSAFDSDYEEIAGFANATLHSRPASTSISAAATATTADASQDTAGILAGTSSSPPTSIPRDNVFTYSVAPRFEINEHASLYARIAKGYRPGGPNVIAAEPAGRNSGRRSTGHVHQL